jgi:hypothetical protein
LTLVNIRPVSIYDGGVTRADADGWIEAALEERRGHLLTEVAADLRLIRHRGTVGKDISSHPKWVVECLTRRCQPALGFSTVPVTEFSFDGRCGDREVGASESRRNPFSCAPFV